MSLPSLDRVWSEFGESPENLQTHSKLTNFMPKKLTIKTKLPLDFRKKYEFGPSLENLQTHREMFSKIRVFSSQKIENVPKK